MFELNEERFLRVLKKVIGENQHVQNNPPKFVPQEDKVLQHVLAELEPHKIENGGVLKVHHVAFKPGRGNLVVEYKPEGAKKILSFVGSHLDVVVANPETWTVNPFELSVDGDKLYGRGTTDCLGHVALMTDLLCTIGEKKPALNTDITVVLIASEENSSIPEVGVDMLMKHGYLDDIKRGPVFWIDCSDTHPCIGTAATAAWTLQVDGRLAHSGFPSQGINSIELATAAVAELQKRFYVDYPPQEAEKTYGFQSTSSLKPTQIRCSPGGLNQINPLCVVQGDIRLTPFHNLKECMTKVEGYVADVNKNLRSLEGPAQGTESHFECLDSNGGLVKGAVTLKWEGEPFKGIACKLDSPGFEALCTATKSIIGEAKPYSVCGSLPLVGDMQEMGYDLQLAGYGKSAVYHGNDEYCQLSDMKNATKILTTLIDLLQ